MDTTSTFWLPPQGSTLAGEVDPLFNFILWASVIMFALVIALMVVFTLKYRRRKRDEGLLVAPTHNTPLELAWTILPTILVFVIFFWGFKTFMDMHVAPKDALEIKVTGQKWFWTFDYATGANSVNELVVPSGKPVRLLMASKDVIHGFFVPDFRVKMDVLPNRYTIVWFEAPSVGEHNIFCTQYCGKGHSEMLGKVKVLSETEFNKWLEAGSGQGEGMAPEEFGAKLYKSKACVTCHTVDGTKLVGPTFKGKFGSMETLSDGSKVLIDENYIRESLLNPKAKVVNGFDPVMPTYQGILKDKQIDALIAYIKSLK
jgi:cytochrome c oxidase subunit II